MWVVTHPKFKDYWKASLSTLSGARATNVLQLVNCSMDLTWSLMWPGLKVIYLLSLESHLTSLKGIWLSQWQALCHQTSWQMRPTSSASSRLALATCGASLKVKFSGRPRTCRLSSSLESHSLSLWIIGPCRMVSLRCSTHKSTVSWTERPVKRHSTLVWLLVGA